MKLEVEMRVQNEDRCWDGFVGKFDDERAFVSWLAEQPTAVIVTRVARPYLSRAKLTPKRRYKS